MVIGVWYISAMVTYRSIVQSLPPELQVTLLQLVEAVEQSLREQLSPRKEVIDVRALANGLLESQHSTLQRMDRLEAALLQLAEAQQRTEARLEQLAEAQQRTEARVEQLAEAQQRTEARVEQLAEAQQRTEAHMEQLTKAQHQTEQGLNRLTSEVGELTKAVRAMQPRLAKADGWQLEQRYVERAPSYFGRWLRQVEVLWPGRLDRNLEKALDANLTVDEKDEVLLLDAILRGKAPSLALQDEIYVALEASVTINQHDVERANERAKLLRRIGVRVVAVVAGETLEADAEAAAQTTAVAILRNDKRQGWEQALAAA